LQNLFFYYNFKQKKLNRNFNFWTKFFWPIFAQFYRIFNFDQILANFTELSFFWPHFSTNFLTKFWPILPNFQFFDQFFELIFFYQILATFPEYSYFVDKILTNFLKFFKEIRFRKKNGFLQKNLFFVVQNRLFLKVFYRKFFYGMRKVRFRKIYLSGTTQCFRNIFFFGKMSVTWFVMQLFFGVQVRLWWFSHFFSKKL